MQQGLDDQELGAIRTFYRAIGEQDLDLLDRAVTPAWQDIPLNPGQGPGPDGLKPILRGLFAALPDLTVEIDEIFGTGGRAGVRARMLGTHRGELFGIAATGKKVSIRMHEVHHLEGGRITRTYHLEDWLAVFEQLGAFPPALHPEGA